MITNAINAVTLGSFFSGSPKIRSRNVRSVENVKRGVCWGPVPRSCSKGPDSTKPIIEANRTKKRPPLIPKAGRATRRREGRNRRVETRENRNLPPRQPKNRSRTEPPRPKGRPKRAGQGAWQVRSAGPWPGSSAPAIGRLRPSPKGPVPKGPRRGALERFRVGMV